MQFDDRMNVPVAAEAPAPPVQDVARPLRRRVPGADRLRARLLGASYVIADLLRQMSAVPRLTA